MSLVASLEKAKIKNGLANRCKGGSHPVACQALADPCQRLSTSA